MLRVATLAAFAVAAVVAAPASAASIQVSTAGKSPDQVKAEVAKAAVQLCHKENADFFYNYDMQAQTACVRATVRAALAQPRNTSATTFASR